jgi:O-6-methylguanine DNA methyltransferase
VDGTAPVKSRAATMVRVAVAESGGIWFGIAFVGRDLVATATGADRETALAGVARCLPSGTAWEADDGDGEFVRDTATMLAALEHGDESNKRYTISIEVLSRPLRNILAVAATVPIGYITTYGDISKAAGSVARAVGRVMATNPLYPIVPCHRVLGAEFALVGYGGRQDSAALTAKLDRLRAEIRGFTDPTELPAAADALRLYPVEWAIEVAEGRRSRTRAGSKQIDLFG